MGRKFVWATTREPAANTYIAPQLAIPALPVATAWGNNRTSPRFGEARDRDSAAWKAGALKSIYRGRPLVWLDDQAHRWAGARVASRLLQGPACTAVAPRHAAAPTYESAL